MNQANINLVVWTIRFLDKQNKTKQTKHISSSDIDAASLHKNGGKKAPKKVTKRGTVYLTNPVGQKLLFCRGGQLKIHKILG